jgi:4-amino-4-deoxy-L-arabinose transferase-like glycosyltransferase
MRAPPPVRLGDLLALLLILAGAAGVRAWYLCDSADYGSANGPVRVQSDRQGELNELVESIRDHDGFASQAPLSDHKEQTAHTAPGYPWVLYAVELAPGDRDRTIRWVQVALGALTAGCYFFFARRAFDSRLVGFLAGLFVALNPFGIVATSEINDGILAAFLLAVSLLLGARAAQTGGAFTSLLYGLALAGSALTRAALLPFGFLAVLWFLYRCRRIQHGWLCAVLAFLGFISGLVPWGIRNYQAFGDVLPIVDSTYLELYVGNNPLATGGPQMDQEVVQALVLQQGSDRTAKANELAQMGQVERYRSLSGPLWQEVKSNPDGTLRRRLWAGLCFFFGEDWLRAALSRRDLFAEEGLHDAFPALFTGTLLLMLFFGALGWRWSFGWRYESMPAGLAVVWVFIPYLLSHGEARYGPRLPVDGVILCYVAFALAAFVPAVVSDLREGPESEQERDDRPAR